MYKVVQGRKIRVGIVGCGRISKNHFGSFEKHADHLELISVCDIDQVVLDHHIQSYGVKGYRNLELMLENEDMDLLVVCTPSGLHPNHVVMAAEHGIHVLTEKPMATRWKDGVRMIQACDKAGVRLFVVKQNRKNATLQLLKRAVEEKRFGRIHMVHMNVFWSRPQEYYDAAKWRGTWELDGGAFMNQASHYVDLLDWLIGPIASVQAMTGALARDIEVEDSGVLNIRWRNGALGSMAVTMLTYPKNLEGSMTILGEKGTVRVGGVAVNDIQHWEFEDEKDYDASINDASYSTTSVYGFGHPLYYKNVVAVLQGKAESEVDGREGLKCLEVLIASYLSARDGCTVNLPLEF